MKSFYSALFMAVFFGLVFPATAQDSGIPTVARKDTKDAKTLALALTAGLPDSAKVLAIHYWITHNIKYDVKKALVYDFQRTSIKKILKKRKAICLGYTDLMDSLCYYAGVTCVPVYGYAKTFHTDYGDHCFLDEHAWNAVELQGNWWLVDATWDAGFIKPFKRSAWGWVVAVATLGNKEVLKYKPHFVRFPTDFYLLREGPFFQTDHLPTLPMWQLVSPSLSIQEWQQDPRHYFREYNDVPSPEPLELDNPKRSAYASLDENERLMQWGKQVLNFNPQNPYSLLRAERLLAKVSKDSTRFHIKQIKVLSKQTQVSLALQKKELLETNSKKRNLAKSDTRRWIQSSNTAIKNLKTGRNRWKKSMNACKKTKIKTVQANKKLQKSTKFDKAKEPKKAKSADSLACANKFNAGLDTLLLYNRLLQHQQNKLDQLMQEHRMLYAAYGHAVNQNTSTAVLLYFLRTQGYDDLDYPIKLQRDSLFHSKFQQDSLLYHESQLLYSKVLQAEFKKWNGYVARLVKGYHSQAQTLVRWKRACVTENGMEIRYNNNAENFQVQTDSCLQQLKNYKSYCKTWYKSYRKQIKPSKKEARAFARAYLVENKAYFFRKREIALHYKSLKKACSGQ